MFICFLLRKGYTTKLYKPANDINIKYKELVQGFATQKLKNYSEMGTHPRMLLKYFGRNEAKNINFYVVLVLWQF